MHELGWAESVFSILLLFMLFFIFLQINLLKIVMLFFSVDLFLSDLEEDVIPWCSFKAKCFKGLFFRIFYIILVSFVFSANSHYSLEFLLFLFFLSCYLSVLFYGLCICTNC